MNDLIPMAQDKINGDINQLRVFYLIEAFSYIDISFPSWYTVHHFPAAASTQQSPSAQLLPFGSYSIFFIQ